MQILYRSYGRTVVRLCSPSSRISIFAGEGVFTMLVHLCGEAASGKGASFQKARLDQIFHRNTKRFRNPVNRLGRAFFKLRSAAAQIVYGGVGNTAVLGQSVFCDLLIIDQFAYGHGASPPEYYYIGKSQYCQRLCSGFFANPCSSRGGTVRTALTNPSGCSIINPQIVMPSRSYKRPRAIAATARARTCAKRSKNRINRGVAHLVERLVWDQEARSSSLRTSTIFLWSLAVSEDFSLITAVQILKVKQKSPRFWRSEVTPKS